MQSKFDVIVVGGGATGLGVALEAVTRGYSVALFEAQDFGSGTSSKSTKLVHGGLRYLANLDIALVKEGLEERRYFLDNAPHLSYPIGYLVPFYSYSEAIQYLVGIKLYDALAGKLRLAKSYFINKSKIAKQYPNLTTRGLLGGMVYYDGSFDDTRLLVSLVKTVKSCGGLVCNYTKVNRLLTNSENKINGVEVVDSISGEVRQYFADVVINATGTFSDVLINQATSQVDSSLVMAAQGTHIVISQDKFPLATTVVIPKTSDGRLVFILPWHDRLIIGTTDVAVDKPSLEPQAAEAEIDFILTTLNNYVNDKISRSDILSVFAGQRPLVKNPKATSSSKVSRKHGIFNHNNLVTIVGGKWTIFRRMGQDTIDYIEQNILQRKTQSVTRNYQLVDATINNDYANHLNYYGKAKNEIMKLDKLHSNQLLIEGLPYTIGEIIYIIRHEFVIIIEDVIARRTRMLYLDASKTKQVIAQIAILLQQELGYSDEIIRQQITQANRFVDSYIVNDKI